MPGQSDQPVGNGSYLSGSEEGETGNKCDMPTSSRSDVGTLVTPGGWCSGFWVKLWFETNPKIGALLKTCCPAGLIFCTHISFVRKGKQQKTISTPLA